MPVPLQHDADRLRTRLADWLAARWAVEGVRAGAQRSDVASGGIGPDATSETLSQQGSAHAGRPRVDVGPVQVPAARGFSAETLFVDVRRTLPGGVEEERSLVVRLAPTRYRVYPRDRFTAQCRLLTVLDRRTDLPVPAVHGFEEDPGVLGAPFLVMDRVDGDVPADLPSYHREGRFAAAEAGERAALWWAGLAVLPAVHRLDVRRLGLAALDLGPVGTVASLHEYHGDRDFYGTDDPAVSDAFGWLADRLPGVRPPGVDAEPVLLWGDARLGNLVFTPGRPRVAAVLDWEMAALGDPVSDLAWFLHLDRHLSEGIGAPRLPGLPDRAASVARYAEWTGRAVTGLAFHSVFAALRFALIAARVNRLLIEHHVVPPDAAPPLARNAARLLARTLAEAEAIPDRSAPPARTLEGPRR